MKNLRYKQLLAIALSVCLGSWSSLMAQDRPGSIMLNPDEISWSEGPPSIPPGARIAVIEGVLKDPVPFIFRLKLPPGYRIPPHSHPAIEHVTVLSGKLYFGPGDKAEPSEAKAFTAGSVIVMQSGDSMFGWTAGEETVIQVHGVGPWGINYVNPGDDPRKK